MEYTKNKITGLAICFNCKHFIDNGNYTCAAFPDGIPDEIIFGENDHEKPLKGQTNSIVYDSIEKA